MYVSIMGTYVSNLAVTVKFQVVPVDFTRITLLIYRESVPQHANQQPCGQV